MPQTLDRRTRLFLRIVALGWLALWLTPWIAAVVLTPRFTTQDGPAHVYNTQIVETLSREPTTTITTADDPARIWRETFAVSWRPVPNWAGTAAVWGLGRVFSWDQCDRAQAVLTLILLAGAIVMLPDLSAHQGKGNGSPWRALWATMAAGNVTWLWGFTSYLVGTSLGLLTLSFWWSRRDKGGWFSAGMLALLLILGYFCHLVSLGLTLLALATLVATAPLAQDVCTSNNHYSERMQRRWRWTGLGLLPLAPLAWLYRSLASAGGGPMTPTWGHLTDWRSPTAWVRQWTWIDPISLARKVELPFLREPGLAGRCLAPAIWLTAAALIWTGIAIYHRIRTKTQNNPSSQAARAWGAAALVCFLAGALGPDSLGPTHGHYLPQRGVLTALALIPPFWDWSTRSHGRRLGAACLVVAWVMQSLWIWDYARMCQDRVEPFLAARPWVGTDQRVASLVMNTQSPFRANPMLHVDCALGWGDGRYNVIYGNYETLHYYFPVQFRPEVNRPPARVFEDLALMEDEAQRPERLARWQTLLDDYDAVIDILIIWDGRGSEIPVLTPLQAERWGQPVLNTPRLKVYQQQPSRKRIVSQ